MEAFSYILCDVCNGKEVSCITCGDVGYLLSGDSPVAKKTKASAVATTPEVAKPEATPKTKRTFTSKTTPKVAPKSKATVDTPKPEDTKPESKVVKKFKEVIDKVVTPVRSAGWRWKAPGGNTGIVMIDGAYYLVRMPGNFVILLTKLDRVEVTYYLDYRNVHGCSCLSREEGGCKHYKGLKAIQYII